MSSLFSDMRSALIGQGEQLVVDAFQLLIDSFRAAPVINLAATT